MMLINIDLYSCLRQLIIIMREMLRERERERESLQIEVKYIAIKTKYIKDGIDKTQEN